MKIGIVTQSYYPVRGGVSEHVYHLSRELMRRGHDLTVITGGARQPEDRGLRVIRIGRTIPLSLNGATVSMVVGLGLGKQLQRIVHEERFDLVHVHSPLDPVLPLIATSTLTVPTVGTFHTYRRPNRVFDVGVAIARRQLRRALDRLSVRIAVSTSAANFIRRYAHVSFRIIPNGVDTERFSPQQPPFPQFRDGVFTVLYVGRIDPRKGARYLFQAFPFLERSISDYRILIVGSGWRKKVYQHFIPFGLEQRVHFAGFSSWGDLPRFYRSADVYCSPAVGGESFGIVLLEAMASGLPIVASDIEGYRNVLTDGREGLFTRPRDPQLIAEKIIQLANNPGLRREMGRNGRATALRYDWKRITDEVEAVYRELV